MYNQQTPPAADQSSGDKDLAYAEALMEGIRRSLEKELPPSPAPLNFERLEELFGPFNDSPVPEMFLRLRPDFKERYQEFLKQRSKGIPSLAQGIKCEVQSQDGTTEVDGGIYTYDVSGASFSTGDEDQPDFFLGLGAPSMTLGIVCKPERLLQQANAVLADSGASITARETARLLAAVCTNLVRTAGSTRSDVTDAQLVAAGILSERLRVERSQHNAAEGKNLKRARRKGATSTSHRSIKKWIEPCKKFLAAQEENPKLTIHSFCVSHVNSDPKSFKMSEKRLTKEIGKLKAGLRRYLKKIEQYLRDMAKQCP